MEFRVRWSEEDQEYVATCDKYPRLSHLSPSSWDAFVGLQALIEDEEAATGLERRRRDRETELEDDGSVATWHYLPVYIEHEGERFYTLCKVHLRNGKLWAWTENREIAPGGDSPEDLAGSLNRMLNDLRRWKPVRFEDLKVGMVLEEND